MRLCSRDRKEKRHKKERSTDREPSQQPPVEEQDPKRQRREEVCRVVGSQSRNATLQDKLPAPACLDGDSPRAGSLFDHK